MIGGIRAHGDLHGLSDSDIQAAISASYACKQSDLPITDVQVASPSEIHVYWYGSWGENESYGIMRLVKGRWISGGCMIVTS